MPQLPRRGVDKQLPAGDSAYAVGAATAGSDEAESLGDEDEDYPDEDEDYTDEEEIVIQGLALNLLDQMDQLSQVSGCSGVAWEGTDCE
jgi:hypothetical protein